MRSTNIIVATSILTALLGVTGSAMASSHREAPAIAEDQFADNTDVYAFISPESPDRVTFVANFVPFLLPASGPNFYRFADSVLYEIKVDNDGDARPDISYQFRFQTTVADGTTFLYNTGAVTSLTDANLNVRQSYTLTKVSLADGSRTVLARDAAVAPWYVGRRSFTEAGCGTNADTCYDTVANAAVTPLTGLAGGKVFAGPRDEPFFVDLHVFDLLGVGGAATTDGVNVMTLALEVPIADVARGGMRPPAGDMGPRSAIGVYATASRRQITILRRGRGEDEHGQWTQVSRLGWPLINEAIIGLADKDKFNRTNPVNDVTNYGGYILMPGLPGLLNAVLGIPCPATPAGGRTDFVPLLSGAGSAVDTTMYTPADMLRLDIRADATFANQRDNVVAGQAFPNGRQLADDVTDIELTYICNPALTTAVGDGVNANDHAFLATFPYVPRPSSGNP